MVYVSAIVGFVLVFATTALAFVGTEWLKSINWSGKFREASLPTQHQQPQTAALPDDDDPRQAAIEPRRPRGDGLSDLAKTTNTPYWINLQGGPRPAGAIAIRFAFIAVDIWRGDAPRIPVDDLLDRESGKPDDWFIRSDEDHYPRLLRRQLRQSHLSKDDQATIDEMRSHPIGKLAYLACSTATAIELSTSWRHDIFDEKMIRVDLDAEVAEISTSCARLRTAVDKLGPHPPDDLGDDPDVLAIHAGRTEIYDERLGVLIQRLRAFTRYRAGIEQVDKQLAKLEWVMKVGTEDDTDEFIAAAADELGSERLNRAAEEFDSVSGAIIESMLTDAKKLSRIVRYS
ncbi:hypothetical protein DFR67_103338 [Williamsia limnetica]|uniref:Uncharacterized protein n=1 Tax=Williamsia limnetica TaxID=882452 RepID=A0A318RZQ3_WILLI|nr:hypothetical protein [Williamsia limnetica]PYE19425.1 hypothetical protein DFR67_103338 [Williamsia limnetica]